MKRFNSSSTLYVMYTRASAFILYGRKKASAGKVMICVFRSLSFSGGRTGEKGELPLSETQKPNRAELISFSGHQRIHLAVATLVRAHVQYGRSCVCVRASIDPGCFEQHHHHSVLNVSNN